VGCLPLAVGVLLGCVIAAVGGRAGSGVAASYYQRPRNRPPSQPFPCCECCWLLGRKTKNAIACIGLIDWFAAGSDRHQCLLSGSPVVERHLEPGVGRGTEVGMGQCQHRPDA